MEQEKKSRHGCLWVLIAIESLALIVMFFVIVALVMVNMSFSQPIRVHKAGVDERPEMNEIWSCGSGDVKVVRIPLYGLIAFEGSGSSFVKNLGSTESALRSIKKATSDQDVKAIILEVDSGGGGITASDILYKALKDFKESREDRKVVAVFGDVAASGGYYVALAADYIIAHPTTITGSIGVLMQMLNVRGLGEKIGVKEVVVKSGPNKDLLNPFGGDLTIEQSLMLQGIIDNLHNRFKSLVSEGRKLPAEEVQRLADGSIFNADTALKCGLIDEIGYWENALAKTAELLGEDSVKVYRYEEEFKIADFFKSMQTWNPVNSLLNKFPQTRMLYLWEM